MSSAMNHKRRSHRSEKAHFSCLHQMKQFAPVEMGAKIPAGLIPLTLLWAVSGKHSQGRRSRNKKNG